MNAFNIEFPSICLRAIGKLHYATCGVEYQEEHYSGNFWWTDCAHLSQLPPLQGRFNWMEPEFWAVRVHEDAYQMLAFARHCAYQAFTSNVSSLYDEQLHREKYLQRLWQAVVSAGPRRLPPRMQKDKEEAREYPGNS